VNNWPLLLLARFALASDEFVLPGGDVIGSVVAGGSVEFDAVGLGGKAGSSIGVVGIGVVGVVVGVVGVAMGVVGAVAGAGLVVGVAVGSGDPPLVCAAAPKDNATAQIKAANLYDWNFM